MFAIIESVKNEKSLVHYFKLNIAVKLVKSIVVLTRDIRSISALHSVLLLNDCLDFHINVRIITILCKTNISWPKKFDPGMTWGIPKIVNLILYVLI